MNRWTLSSVVRDGGGHLRAERWRGILLLALVTILVAVVVTLEEAARTEALQHHRGLIAAGSTVVRALPTTEEAKIDAGRCAALDAADGVRAAGGLVSDGPPMLLARAPDQVLTPRKYVGALPAAISGGEAFEPADLIIPVELARAWGIADDSPLLVRAAGVRHTLHVRTINSAARLPDPGLWLAVPTAPTGSVTECWVEFQPWAAHLAVPLVQTWLGTNSAALTVQPLLAEDELRIDPQRAFDERPTSRAWVAAGLCIAVIFGLVLWFRRSEIALYRSVGASRAVCVATFAGPASVIVAAGAVSGAMVGAYVGALGDAIEPMMWETARLAGLTLAVAVPAIAATVLVISSGGLAAYIRDRL